MASGAEVVGHDLRTARQMGSTAIQNGELLTLAAEQFDVFVTVDRNLSFQQNLGALSIAVIVLKQKRTGSPKAEDGMDRSCILSR